MEYVVELNDVLATVKLGEIIGRNSYPNMVIALSGDLGAGKTTLTKGLAKGMGIYHNVNSPTFTIMKIYDGPLVLYHLDVYRIENENSDFELEEYFYLGGCAVVEWANNIRNLLPDTTINIELLVIDETTRIGKIVTSDERWLNKIINEVKESIC